MRKLLVRAAEVVDKGKRSARNDDRLSSKATEELRRARVISPFSFLFLST